MASVRVVLDTGNGVYIGISRVAATVNKLVDMATGVGLPFRGLHARIGKTAGESNIHRPKWPVC